MNDNLIAEMPNGTGYQKPKNWKDLSVEEKLERLREQVKSAQHSAARANNRTYSTQRWVEDHKHDPTNGEALVTARKSYGEITDMTLSAVNLKDIAEGNCYF